MTAPDAQHNLLGTPRTTTPQIPDLANPARPTGWRCDCHGTRWLLTTERLDHVIVSMAPAEPEYYRNLNALLDAHLPVTVCDVDNVATLWAEKDRLEFRVLELEENIRRLTESTTKLAATIAALPDARNAAAIAHARAQRDTALECAYQLEARLAARNST